MPFADYEDFEDCVSENSDKDDPEAYCAEIKRQVEGESDMSTEESAGVSNAVGNGDSETKAFIDAAIRDAIPISQSSHTPTTLDLAAVTTDVLVRAEANGKVIWMAPDGAVAYRADIPEKYVDGTDLSEADFVPNADVAAAAQDALDYVDENGLPNPDAQQEGLARAQQLVDHHDSDEPLAADYWVEIEGFHARHRAQDNHECDESEYDPCMADPGVFSDHTWGSDAGYEQAQRVVDVIDTVDSGETSNAATDAETDAHTVEMKGPVAAVTGRPETPADITKPGTNKIDMDALPEEYKEALEADDFLIYGKASIEQWDDDDVPTLIEMDALEDALDRFFGSDLAPGIISRYHSDIPVGRPLREYELDSDTTLELATAEDETETHEFEAGDTLRSHVRDADGDGTPELWLVSNLANDTEPAKRARILSMLPDDEGGISGYSVTIHRNDDEVTPDGRRVTECDLHAVTLGTGEQIKNAGSTFDLAEFKSTIRNVAGLPKQTADAIADAVRSGLH